MNSAIITYQGLAWQKASPPTARRGRGPQTVRSMLDHNSGSSTTKRIQADITIRFAPYGGLFYAVNDLIWPRQSHCAPLIGSPDQGRLWPARLRSGQRPRPSKEDLAPRVKPSWSWQNISQRDGEVDPSLFHLTHLQTHRDPSTTDNTPKTTSRAITLRTKPHSRKPTMIIWGELDATRCS